MFLIRSVPPDPADPLAAHARTLFAQYGEFLRRTQSCNTFNFARYDQETATLPADYAAHNGEVLLVLEGEIPAACIAIRAARTGPAGFSPDPTNCTGEIKRLFVADPFRSRGLARLLVAEALTRLAVRNFTRIILDTDHVHMPAAGALYASLGFTPYAPPEGNISFLHKTIHPVP